LINKFEDSKINSFKIFFDDVTGAYTHIFKTVKHIKFLRIYAPSTGVILPHFLANKNLQIDECRIMLKKLPPTDKLFLESHTKEIEVLIERWKMMVTDGRIKKLTIISYDKTSDLYYVICDENILMTDLFIINHKDTAGQQTNNAPIIVTANTREGKEYILRCKRQFDNYEIHYKTTCEVLYTNIQPRKSAVK